MNIFTIIGVLLALFVSVNPAKASGNTPNINKSSALLKNAANGMVKEDTVIRKNMVEPTKSSELSDCLTGVVQLIGAGEIENSIQRYGVCNRNIMDIDDSLAYLKTGNHLFSWLYSAKSDWIVSKINVPKEVVKKRRLTIYYSRLRRISKETSSLASKATYALGGIEIPGLEASVHYATKMIDQSYQVEFTDPDFEKNHPSAVLSRRMVHLQINTLVVLKHIIKTQQQYLRQLTVNASSDDLQAIMILAPAIKKNTAQVKRAYSIFISRDVVVPVLLRTQQLLFIADKESWTGFDHDYMSQAAANFALLNKDMILTASSPTKKLFRKTYSLFKDAAGKAEMEDLKVIQNLAQAYSEPNAGNDWWVQ